MRRDVFGRRGVRVIGRRVRAAARTAFVVLALAAGISPASAQTPDDTLRTTLAGLSEASYPDKEAIVATLSEAGHPSTSDIFTAFIEDRLYVRHLAQEVPAVHIETGRNHLRPLLPLLTGNLALIGHGSR